MPDTRTKDELRAEVARRLFGLVLTEDGCILRTASDGYQYRETPPDYPSDHNAAMGLVVPGMEAQGYTVDIMGYSIGLKGVHFYLQGKCVGVARSTTKDLPRAICEAALAALDAEGGE